MFRFLVFMKPASEYMASPVVSLTCTFRFHSSIKFFSHELLSINLNLIDHIPIIIGTSIINPKIMSEFSRPDNSDVENKARSAKKWMGFLLFIIFSIILQLYRLEFQIHSDQVDQITRAKKVMFLALVIQTISSMVCLDFFYKRKYVSAKIISMIIALLGIVAIIIFIFIPEMQSISI